MRLVAIALMPLLLAIAACDGGAALGPPTLRLGRDLCAECGMTIHEERSAAALIVDDHGRHDYLLFDDIGCLLHVQHARADVLRVVEAFVHDHSSVAWTPARSALFLRTDGSSLRTPMGSGIAAYASRASAERAQLEHGGEVIDYEGLISGHRAWADEGRNRPGG